MSNKIYKHAIIKSQAFGLVLMAFLFSGVVLPHASFAEPPIPPQRPKVMKVSPEYIEKLMRERNLDQNKTGRSEEEETILLQQEIQAKVVPLDTPIEDDAPEDMTTVEEIEIMLSPEPQSNPPPTKSVNTDNAAAQIPSQQIEKNTLMEATKQDVLDILDGRTKRDVPQAVPAPMVEKIPLVSAPAAEEIPVAVAPIKSNAIPVPKIKPNHAHIYAQTEPAAAQESTQSEREETLISFALEPQTIKLDDNIIAFLEGHALSLFEKNKNASMEINAYATPKPDEAHSAVRISLARALEVRKWLMDKGVSPSRLKLNHARDDRLISADDRIDLILIQ